MEKERDKGLRKALDGQAPSRLSSNFTYRTMERIRLETEQREARNERLLHVFTVAAVACTVGCSLWMLYKMYDINLWNILVSTCSSLVSGEGIFWLPILVSLPPLGIFNYWLRKKFGYLLK